MHLGDPFFQSNKLKIQEYRPQEALQTLHYLAMQLNIRLARSEVILYTRTLISNDICRSISIFAKMESVLEAINIQLFF